MVKILNRQLGRTEKEMAANWQPYAIKQKPDGHKYLSVPGQPPAHLYYPGIPASSVSTTTGQVQKNGDIYARTTTTDTPAAESGWFYMHLLTVFLFDEHGNVYRWESYSWPSHAQKLDGEGPSNWTLIDGREFHADKKGKAKIVKINRGLAGFWWLR